MSEQLRSVGLDVGTTTTQLVLSELTVENRASGFAVPDMAITRRRILYKSSVHMTPLLSEELVDGAAIRQIVASEYEKAGIRRDSVQTGAIIITGETSRKENARAVLSELSGFAGAFVVATAGPDLESVLAAKGAGAADWSEQTGKTVLHMDIGGGTSNLALIENGRITRTGCLNVGGRLVKLDGNGCITYISPVLQGLSNLRLGQRPTVAQLEQVADMLTQGLEMAAGLRPRTGLLDQLATREAGEAFCYTDQAVISFSGGVADCIAEDRDCLQFGDIGPVLGRAIRRSRLCQGEFRLGAETIRATVIGAGCHSTQLSGSTVFYRNVNLPVQNLPVAVISQAEQEQPELPQIIARHLREQNAVLAMPGYSSPDYHQVTALAEKIAAGTIGKPVWLCLEGDMAKALGHSLCLRLPPDTPILCIDRVRLRPDSYLDVGEPVGTALPVVVKTLILRGVS